MKKRIRLTESDLHRIVNRSVKRVLNEISTDTLHNALDKSNKMTRGMPNLSNDPKVTRRFRQKHSFGDELKKRHRDEISAIDPDTKRGYNADFDEHPELRNTKAYQLARDYVEDFDWYVNGKINLDWFDVEDLASDVEWDTKIPRSIAFQAIVDCLNDMGYDINSDNDYDDEEDEEDEDY